LDVQEPRTASIWLDQLVSERTLTQEDVDAIADATVQRLVPLVAPQQPPTFALVDVRELAADLGVSTDYVYAHARELGAMRLGSGPKARIRFDLDRARRALEDHPRAQNGGPQRGKSVGARGSGAGGRKLRGRLPDA
jgi:hypothetical protein